MSAEADRCAECYLSVRPRQEGLQCDGCFTWQHRTCKTGVSQRQYREAVKSGKEIDWRCKYCTLTGSSAVSGNEVSTSLAIPVAMSTRIDEASDSVSVEDEPTPRTRHEGMLQESSIDEPQIRDFEPTIHDDITYTVVNGATKRGKAMLIDNQGYTYNIKRRRLNVTDWQCSVRPKDHPCRATVKQKNNDLFERNTCRNGTLVFQQFSFGIILQGWVLTKNSYFVENTMFIQCELLVHPSLPV